MHCLDLLSFSALSLLLVSGGGAAPSTRVTMFEDHTTKAPGLWKGLKEAGQDGGALAAFGFATGKVGNVLSPRKEEDSQLHAVDYAPIPLEEQSESRVGQFFKDASRSLKDGHDLARHPYRDISRHDGVIVGDRPLQVFITYPSTVPAVMETTRPAYGYPPPGAYPTMPPNPEYPTPPVVVFDPSAPAAPVDPKAPKVYPGIHHRGYHRERRNHAQGH